MVPVRRGDKAWSTLHSASICTRPRASAANVRYLWPHLLDAPPLPLLGTAPRRGGGVRPSRGAGARGAPAPGYAVP
ncbi:Hypothetical protein CAP_3215 [Chondromyces apiculatus DSM 436]|uniref:Uncharacterized protein n=1 Tax=Chondromyces apiculatus DSM 436 TaxID=1192034 RepID=A0A017T978_9BACT|nr:Hypothetical protein CAP_3215 [Chondromyces apiculatus DSM 436]